MSLPSGYTTTTAVGILVLWRVTTDGTYSCVTVLAESVAAETIAAIANRDATFGRHVTGVGTKPVHRRTHGPLAKTRGYNRSSVTVTQRPVVAP